MEIDNDFEPLRLEPRHPLIDIRILLNHHREPWGDLTIHPLWPGIPRFDQVLVRIRAIGLGQYGYTK